MAENDVGRLAPFWVTKLQAFAQLAAYASLLKFLIVYYDSLGCTASQIGFLGAIDATCTFFASFMWAHLGDVTYKGRNRDLLIASQVLAIIGYTGICFVGSAVSGAVSSSSVVLAVLPFQITASIGRSAGALNTVLTLEFLRLHKEAGSEVGQTESYGRTRMWGALGWGFSSVVCGVLVDHFGIRAIFVLYTTFLLVDSFILRFALPSRIPSEAERPANSPATLKSPEKSQVGGSFLTNLQNIFKESSEDKIPNRRIELIWLCLNLIMYGAFKAGVEQYLFLYVQSPTDFTPLAPGILMGLMLLVMSWSEVPVFYYFSNVCPKYISFHAVILICESILVCRFLLYTMLPSNNVWLILLIEPMHGLTYGAMNCVSVELVTKRYARDGEKAMLQTVTAGAYVTIGMGLMGNPIWGGAIDFIGFRDAYLGACTCMIAWLAFFFLFGPGSNYNRRLLKASTTDAKLLERPLLLRDESFTT